MNIKIKKYVESLFSHVPYSQKAQELQEEIMADMDAHYEDCISNGKTEQEAFKDTVDSLGNIDELIQKLIPAHEIQDKIDNCKKRNAILTAIAISLYFIGGAAIAGLPSLAAVTGNDPELPAIIGMIVLIILSAIATSMLVYSRMSIPQDVLPYIKKIHKEVNVDISTKNGKLLKAFLSSHLLVCTAIFFLVSFTTGAWHITWIIFLADIAIKQAVISLLEE